MRATARNSRARARYSAYASSATGWPMTTTWLVSAPVGLRSTGFIATSGSTPAAMAWAAWARAISWPVVVT